MCERGKRKTIAPEHVVQAMKASKRYNHLHTPFAECLDVPQDLEWTKHAPVLEATMLAEREEARVSSVQLPSDV